MFQRRFAPIFAPIVLTLVAGCTGASESQPESTGAAASALAPASCAAIHSVNPSAPDGPYTLQVGDREAEIYCHDMAGTPREFVTLASTGPSVNFSQYTSGGYVGGTSVRTQFTKIRIDLTNMRVDISDRTFATSTGDIGGQTAMSYGVAESCSGPPTGLANIDLTGTPFAVARDSFTQTGWYPAGDAVYSNNDQIVDLTGGGACGWTSPTGGRSGYVLQLEHLLPEEFIATLLNDSADPETHQCLMFYGVDGSEHPSRYLWGNGDNGFCGFSSRSELLSNKQATWRIKRVGDGLYTISDRLLEQCLIFYGGAADESPHRYLWGDENGFCGFETQAALLANKQAVWGIRRLATNRFVITNALYQGSSNGCLMFGEGGDATYPTRHLWSGGDNGSCGLASTGAVLSNRQAVWTIEIQETL